MSNEMICMRPSYHLKRQNRRNELQKNSSMMERIINEKSDDLDVQFGRVFSIKSRTATINIIGPLSPEGPDWIDVWLGYQGTSYKNIERAAHESRILKDSGEIDNVIVQINSPGGTVDGVDKAYQALKTISDIGVVYNEGLIASGAVWLASAFNKIYAGTDSAQYGSIGVVVSYLDFTGYYDNFGIKNITITNKESTNKRPNLLTDKGVSVMERELDEIYNVFVSKVTSSRMITKDQIDSLKGEVFIASRAVELGLMDKLQNEDDSESVEPNKISEENGMITKEEQVEIDSKHSIEIEKTSKTAIDLERKRISGINTIAGLEMSASVKTAIESGLSIEDFAISNAESKNLANKNEVDAAKLLRQANPGTKPPSIESNKHGQKPSSNDDDGDGEDEEKEQTSAISGLVGSIVEKDNKYKVGK